MPCGLNRSSVYESTSSAVITTVTPMPDQRADHAVERLAEVLAERRRQRELEARERVDHDARRADLAAPRPRSPPSSRRPRDRAAAGRASAACPRSTSCSSSRAPCARRRYSSGRFSNTAMTPGSPRATPSRMNWVGEDGLAGAGRARRPAPSSPAGMPPPSISSSAATPGRATASAIGRVAASADRDWAGAERPGARRR